MLVFPCQILKNIFFLSLSLDPHISPNPMHYIHSFKESTELMVSLNKARSLTY